MSFLSPKPPPPPAPPPPVTAVKPGNDPAVAEAAARKQSEAQAAERLQRGKASTLLSGGEGGTGDPTAAPTAKRTLLGG